MESLGRLLVVHADELVQRWLVVVGGERLGEHGLSEVALKDSLGLQLRTIGEAIQAGAASSAGLSFATAQYGSAAVSPHRLLGAGLPIDTEERVLQQIPVEEVVDEYAFAADVVEGWLVEREIEVPPAEYRFFHSAMFGLIAESIRRYVKFQSERVAREKAQFVASIAHQMRTPLSALAVKTRAMEHKRPFEESADFRVLRRNLRRLKFLVDGVLRLERSKVSEIPVRPVPLEVGRFVHEVVDDLREDADQKRLRIEVLADQALRADLDADLLTDALGNFVTNAIRYTEHGFVRVSLDQVDDRLVFSVTDTGPGLPEQQLDEPLKPSQPGRQGSTGLGLVIAYRAVEALGGVVSVESTPGKGTSFAFSIPAYPRPQPSTEPESHPAP